MFSKRYPTGPVLKTCRTCAERIKLGAKKCVKCGSYQSFLRYFQVSPSLISALAASLPAASALFVIYNQNKPKQPDSTISYVNFDRSYVRLGIVNSGPYPTYLDKVLIHARGKRLDGTNVDVTMIIEPKYEDNVVGPNSNKLFVLGPEQQFYGVPTIDFLGDGRPPNNILMGGNGDVENVSCVISALLFPNPKL